MVLYPTETLYAIGVNVFDAAALSSLYILKERNTAKTPSWLVRNLEDIKQYAEVPPLAVKIAEQFLPGSLTLILKARMHISDDLVAKDRTIGFRISTDPIAQDLIAMHMEKYNAPLTCTSANISGAPTLSTVGEILQQFGKNAHMIKRVIDDGPRKGLASTVVRVLKDELTILREGEISEREIRKAAGMGDALIKI